MRRPWVWMALAFGCGLYTAPEIRSVFSAVAVLVISIAAAITFRLLREQSLAMAPTMVALFFSLGALYGMSRESHKEILPIENLEVPITIVGHVTAADLWTHDSDYVQLFVDIEKINGLVPMPHRTYRLLLAWNEPSKPIHPGARIRFRTIPTGRLGPLNPGVSGADTYYRLRGIHQRASVRGDAIELIEAPSGWNPHYQASRFRTALAERLDLIVPETAQPLLQTMWLGDRRRLDAETYTRFVETGTAHVLAVSGLHTGIVFVAAIGFSKMLFRSRRLRMVTGLLVVWAFVLMSGARLPAIRAALMITLYGAAEFLNRESDPPTVLAQSFMGFLLFEPSWLHDTGFQLSFASVASLLVFAPPIRERLTWLPSSVRGVVAASIAVQLLPLPIVLLNFHVLPVFSIPINILLVPILGLLLTLTMISSVLVWFLPYFAKILGFAVATFVSGIDRAIGVIQHSDVAAIHPTAPAGVAVLCYWGLVWSVYRYLTRQFRLRTFTVVAAVLCAVLFGVWSPQHLESEITLLDVGHGDAIFMRSAEGGAVLVDAGDRRQHWDRGRDIVAPFLRANHVRRLDWLFVTHADSDHLGGAPYILDHFQIGAVGFPEKKIYTQAEHKFFEQCKARDVAVYFLHAGDRIYNHGLMLDVLWPPKNWEAARSENNLSLVLRAELHDISILLTGDIESSVERQLIQFVDEVDVLKVPHHGSDTSSTQVFLEHLNPSLALGSVGLRQSQSGFSDHVLERYTSLRIPVFHTDRHGALSLRFDDKRVYFQSERIRRRLLAPLPEVSSGRIRNSVVQSDHGRLLAPNRARFVSDRRAGDRFMATAPDAPL